MNTNAALLHALWPKFIEKCEQQILSGEVRYHLTERRSVTDMICDVAGNIWIGGTIVKYVGENRNARPLLEQNFYKIVAYDFLWWVREQENLTAEDKGEKV